MACEGNPDMAARSSLRFAVGSLKFPRSSVWNLWVNRSDAYLTARSMAGTMKLSLHESGVWPVAWTAESGIVSPQTGHRRELTWRRPRPLANGWTEAPAVVIPHTGTTEPLPLSHEELTKPVVWVPGSRPGSAIRFGLVFSPPGIARADRSEGLPGKPSGGWSSTRQRGDYLARRKRDDTDSRVGSSGEALHRGHTDHAHRLGPARFRFPV